MNIGLKIKKLRIEKEMTQEDLAEYAGVSPKAVSRWENSLTFPDITLLPIIANVFDVTVDELLDVNVHKKEQEINKIIEEDTRLGNIGDTEARIEMLRDALIKYPNSFVLMERLANALYGFYCAEYEERDYILNELIPLCEKIISKCDDIAINTSVSQLLCFSYCDRKEYDKAKKIVDKMPGVYTCKDMLLESILQGDELNNLLNENIITCTEWINTSIISKCGLIKDNVEKINLYEKYIKIMEIIFEDGDYGFYNLRIYLVYLKIAENYAELNNIDKTIDNLLKALEFVIKYENLPSKVIYSSSLIKGYTTDMKKTKSNVMMTEKERINMILNNMIYDKVKQSNRYKEIEELLVRIK